jgi:protein-disulfide isomerase
MKKLARMMAMTAALSMFACAGAMAQQSDSDKAASQAEIESLHKEMAAMKEEMKGLRSDMQKILTELKTMKTVQARRAQPTKRNPRKADTTVYDINVGDSPIRGPKDAPVTITVFSDFQCPFSQREYPKLKQVMKQHPDDVCMIFKNFPLSFHKNAKHCSAAVEFARQEKGGEAFWQMHDMIMDNPKHLDVATIRGYAEKLGLDLDKFDALMKDEAKQNELLKEDLTEARKCRVRGTPTVLINGLKLASRNVSDYEKRIAEITKKGADAGDAAKKPVEKKLLKPELRKNE